MIIAKALENNIPNPQTRDKLTGTTPSPNRTTSPTMGKS